MRKISFWDWREVICTAFMQIRNESDPLKPHGRPLTRVRTCEVIPAARSLKTDIRTKDLFTDGATGAGCPADVFVDKRSSICDANNQFIAISLSISDKSSKTLRR